MNPSLNCIVKNFHKDQIGRIISIDLDFNANNLSLCNVYALNDLRQQQEFIIIRSLNTYLMSTTDIENRIIGSDHGTFHCMLLTKRAETHGNTLSLGNS